MEIIS